MLNTARFLTSAVFGTILEVRVSVSGVGDSFVESGGRRLMPTRWKRGCVGAKKVAIGINLDCVYCDVSLVEGRVEMCGKKAKSGVLTEGDLAVSDGRDRS